MSLNHFLLVEWSNHVQKSNSTDHCCKTHNPNLFIKQEKSTAMKMYGRKKLSREPSTHCFEQVQNLCKWHKPTMNFFSPGIGKMYSFQKLKQSKLYNPNKKLRFIMIRIKKYLHKVKSKPDLTFLGFGLTMN